MEQEEKNKISASEHSKNATSKQCPLNFKATYPVQQLHMELTQSGLLYDPRTYMRNKLDKIECELSDTNIWRQPHEINFVKHVSSYTAFPMQLEWRTHGYPYI